MRIAQDGPDVQRLLLGCRLGAPWGLQLGGTFDHKGCPSHPALP